MDYDEETAKRLEIQQGRRFRAAENKLTFFDDPHERSVAAEIKHRRAVSDTYDPEDQR